MDQVIPNLWLGGFPSVKRLRINTNQIQSILSVMKGKINSEVSSFIHHRIPLDDSEDEDALVHFIPAIMFIQGELDQGRRVLVHCQAGISRSATIVAAYLMYSRNIDRDAALALIRRARPGVRPNVGFMTQLETFHQAGFKVSRQSKPTRKFYTKRTADGIVNGASSVPDTNMFAENPSISSDSATATPGGSSRRIRCKMCRQELATREHLAYHSRQDAAVDAPLTNSCPPSPSHPAVAQPSSSSTFCPTQDNPSSSLQSSGDGSEIVSTSTSSTMNENDKGSVDSPGPSSDNRRLTSNISFGADLLPSASIPNVHSSGTSIQSPERHEEAPAVPTVSSNLAVPLQANSRPTSLTQASVTSPVQPAKQSTTTTTTTTPPANQPMIANPKCSGYFLEPMAWMESFLEQGQLAGKILCPNKKCSAKLGSYDWAGMRCGCQEWITPGFCVSRSKVDEIDSSRSTVV